VFEVFGSRERHQAAIGLAMVVGGEDADVAVPKEPAKLFAEVRRIHGGWGS